MKLGFIVVFVRCCIISASLLIAACSNDASEPTSVTPLTDGVAVTQESEATSDPASESDSNSESGGSNQASEPNQESDTNLEPDVNQESQPNPEPDVNQESELNPEPDSTPAPALESTPDATFSINESNYRILLIEAIARANIVEILSLGRETTNLAKELIAMGRAVADGEPPTGGLALVVSTVVAGELSSTGTATEQQYTCSNNGSMVWRFESTQAPSSAFKVSFDNCAIFEKTYNGAFETQSARRSNDIDTYSQFEVVFNGITQALTGTTERSYIFIGNAEKTSWSNVSYSKSKEGNEIDVSNFNWQLHGDATAFPGADDYISYFVSDLEGNIRGIEQYNYEASLTTDFNFSSLRTGQNEISVSVKLNFKKDYFDWINNSLVQPSKPPYPLTDLGSPLQVSTSSSFEDPAALSFVDIVARDKNPQWQTGQVELQASDGSKVVLRPSESDKNKVLIELNDSGKVIESLWSDGYFISMPILFFEINRNEL